MNLKKILIFATCLLMGCSGASWALAPCSSLSQLTKNAEEFGALLTSHHRARLYNLACLLTRNPVDAEDLVQDTLARALSRFEKYEAPYNFQAWLMAIMRNLFFSEKMAERREAEIVSQWKAENPDFHLFVDSSVEDLDSIGHAFSLIPSPFQAPIILRGAGWSYKEIADRLGVPLGTVMSRILRGKKFIEFLLPSSVSSRAA